MNKLTEYFFEASTGVFTMADAAIALDGSDFSRHGLIKRAIAGGEILSIRRGLYCLAPKYQKKPISIYSLAERIYGPSYVSFETALSYHAWIPEAVYACACASYRNGKDFDTPLGTFNYKRVPQCTFFHGIERCEDAHGNIFFMASPVKALADYVYAHGLKWTLINEAEESLRIDREDSASVTGQELSGLIDNYANHRVKNFLKGWREELHL